MTIEVEVQNASTSDSVPAQRQFERWACSALQDQHNSALVIRDLPLLGDVIICAPLVVSEALAQGKDAEAHWAHLTIHGVLHLLGYDHQSREEAAKMESLEVNLLHTFGFPDPYQ
jgi:rRNA maturation RNase YbeY